LVGAVLMEEDVEAINGLKHLLDFYLLEPTFFPETVVSENLSTENLERKAAPRTR
jgi:hypothetical protein